MPAKKAQKGKGSAKKGTGHYAVSTEESRHHEASQKKRDKIAKAHKEEYSAENSHSMSRMDMFRSHAGNKAHQKDLHRAEAHMGISVQVQRNIKAAMKAQEKALEAEAKRDREKKAKISNLRVNTSSPAVKGPTIPRPYSLSSPRVKTPTTTPDQDAASRSPSRNSKDANVVKYHATEAAGKSCTPPSSSLSISLQQTTTATINTNLPTLTPLHTYIYFPRTVFTSLHH